jgi:membrane glycosyltransferase
LFEEPLLRLRLLAVVPLLLQHHLLGSEQTKQKLYLIPENNWTDQVCGTTKNWKEIHISFKTTWISTRRAVRSSSLSLRVCFAAMRAACDKNIEYSKDILSELEFMNLLHKTHNLRIKLQLDTELRYKKPF